MKSDLGFNKILTIPILLLALVSVIDGANILFFVGIGSYSHRIAMWPLVDKLSDRGHQVTFVSSLPRKTPHGPTKVIDYVPASLKNRTESLNGTADFYSLRLSGQIARDWFLLPSYGVVMCETLLNEPKYLDWVNSSKFDLIFIDPLANECAYGMAYKWKAKIIVINTASSFPYFPDLFGYSDESSWLPDVIYHHPQDMNIYQRFLTIMVPIYFKYLREYDYFPKLEAILREKLELKDMPSLTGIERNVSLVFLNHNYAEDYARPFPPNVVPIGGMQCEETDEKLPKEMEDFLNKGKSGFIYISFGSYAELSKFPQKIQNAFINTVKNLQDIQFIWKLDKDAKRPKDLPSNVYTAKWMPQKSILAHSKIRGFITHGGLLGIQEAICNSVPLIAFPIFAEQDSNAVKLSNREIGIKLEITSVTEGQLQKAINNILHDEKYKTNMKRISAVFKDKPVKPVDTAVWWTEFVLRHEDTAFLRPLSVYQSWWKRRQLDVWAILFIILIVAVKVICSTMTLVSAIILKTAKPVSVKFKSL